MAAPKLYYNPISSNSRRVLIAAKELGVALDLQLLDWNKGELKTPEYLRKNPNGKVPTLEDNGWVLWESNAIMSYLADTKPGNALYPTEPRPRAEVNRWFQWTLAHLEPAVGHIAMERWFKPAFMNAPTDETLLKYGEDSLKRFAPVLNGWLESNDYLVNKTYSLADISAGAIWMYCKGASIDTKPYRHIERWLERLESRPAWKETKPAF